MKTMLKSRFSKSSIWSHGLLLMVTPGLPINKLPERSFKDVMETMGEARKRALRDTAYLPGNDSLFAVRSTLPDSLAQQLPPVPLNPSAAKSVRKFIRENAEEMEMVRKRS